VDEEGVSRAGVFAPLAAPFELKRCVDTPTLLDSRVDNMEEKSVQIYLDIHADSHASLFDLQWAGRLLDSTRNTSLYDPAFVLCELWKSASNGFRMPHFLLVSLEAYHDGVFRNHRPPTQQLVQALLANLRDDPILGLRNMQMQNLIKRLAELDGQMESVLRNNTPTFDRAEMWKQIARSTEFALGTSALREMCHNSLLFGYENYLKHCLEIVAPRTKGSSEKELKFGERIVSCFGKDVADKVHDEDIKLAREYRHVILHNGGRVDAKAKKAGIKLEIGDRVVIPIEALRELSLWLANRVDLVTERSLEIVSRTAGPHS
jgi:hypothetical protein